MAATVKIQGTAEFEKAVANLKAQSDHSEALMKLLAVRIRSMQMRHFKEEVDSEGKPWAELSQWRIRERSGRVAKGIKRRIAKGRTGMGGGSTFEAEIAALPLFAGKRYPKLQDTGRLKTSITAFNTDKLAGAGTNVVYAKVHQYGYSGTRTMKRNLKAGGVKTWNIRINIPKREYLYINDAEKKVLTEMVITQMIKKQLKMQ